ncbi:SMI1/KNR4 family protein [Streptomyces sp. cg36]|uniref:SMI1/KNR4 family protein n=1 Tax=Streptomyces sp. cg36 TaxID=3238798 RepID=UPI0034E1F603
MDQSASDGPFHFEHLWKRFDDWLTCNAPEEHAVLRPGASDADILTLEVGIGFQLTGDLKALLSMHNGVTPRRSSMEAGGFVLGYSLLGTEGILEWQQNLAEMAEDAEEEGYEEEVVGRTAHRQWVPFAQKLSGDLLFVDHRIEHYGEVGEISFGSPEYVWLWPGMGLMMDDICRAVEGMSPLPTVGCRPSIHEERMLEWVVS